MMATQFGSLAQDTFQYGGLTVKLVQGDITKESTECIINSSNRDLDFRVGAVSQALVDQAGPDFQKACLRERDNIRKNGVALTKAGRLKCQYVLHIVAPDSELGWFKIMKQSIELVAAKGFTSLSIPALGTGDMNISVAVMANVVAETIMKFGYCNLSSSLKLIRIVVFLDSMMADFISAFAGKNQHSSTLQGYMPITSELALSLQMPSLMIEQKQLVAGEKEALAGNKAVYFSMKAERFFKNSPEEHHFRTAESQFYRKIGVLANQFGITKVEYVVNPKLITRFKQAQLKLKQTRGENLSHSVLAFHGTTTGNVKEICENGFLVPGDSGYKKKTDTGYFGAGVYFSGYAGYSIPYALVSDPPLLILCQVLIGKYYTCNNRQHGQPLKTGFDSHISPEGKELIIFNTSHILPVYIIHCKPLPMTTVDTARE